MKIELRKNFKWSLVVPTSMGVRITPVNAQPVHCSDTFIMHVTSAETNVASVPSYLGLPVKVLTTFVKDSPIARMIKDNLASRHMAYEGVEVDQGGPCLLYTSDAADDLLCVDLGGRRIIKKKKTTT